MVDGVRTNDDPVRISGVDDVLPTGVDDVLPTGVDDVLPIGVDDVLPTGVRERVECCRCCCRLGDGDDPGRQKGWMGMVIACGFGRTVEALENIGGGGGAGRWVCNGGSCIVRVMLPLPLPVLGRFSFESVSTAPTLGRFVDMISTFLRGPTKVPLYQMERV